MGLNIENKSTVNPFGMTSFFENKKEKNLNLLKELVGMMNGQISLQDGIGGAATFIITIPNTNKYPSTDIRNNNMFSLLEVAEEREPRLTSRFNSFIEKIKTIVEENIEDDTFGISQLCHAACLSRSQLHNKIKAATGISTSIYIRNIRLAKAKALLMHSDKNVSEVAYDVGFKDASYFSRLFTEKYGRSPRTLRNL